MGAEAAALVVSRVREVGSFNREAHEDVTNGAIVGGVVLLQVVALALSHRHTVLEPQWHMSHRHLARDGKLASLPNYRSGHGRLSGAIGL